MAVNLTPQQLADALRMGSSPEELAEATRLLAYATEAVHNLAPAAPSAVHNEAAIRLAAYIFDSPTDQGLNISRLMVRSGAGGMLRPYRLHRAAKARGEAVQEQTGTGTGTAGIDLQARAAAAANTSFLSTFIARVQAVVVSIVPAWARQPNAPTVSGKTPLRIFHKNSAAAVDNNDLQNAISNPNDGDLVAAYNASAVSIWRYMEGVPGLWHIQVIWNRAITDAQGVLESGRLIGFQSFDLGVTTSQINPRLSRLFPGASNRDIVLVLRRTLPNMSGPNTPDETQGRLEVWEVESLFGGGIVFRRRVRSEIPKYDQLDTRVLHSRNENLFWETLNAVPNTPGTSSGVGHVLTVSGENDQDYHWAAPEFIDAVARSGIATLQPIVTANRAEIAELTNAEGTGLGKLRGVFAITSPQTLSNIPAYLTTNVAGERDGDLAIVEHGTDFVVQVWRYDLSQATWVKEFEWSTNKPTAWATEGNGERIPAAKLPQEIPFAAMRPELFDSETEAAIAAANANIAFNVSDVIGGETIAQAGTFQLSAAQVAEPDAQIRIDYDLTDAVRTGQPPTEVELILRVDGSGAIVQSLPVHDRHADILTFDVSSLSAATTLKWAIIVKTKGGYSGTIEITNARFHSSDGAADPFIRRVASALVNSLSKVVQGLAARVTALEDSSGGGGGGGGGAEVLISTDLNLRTLLSGETIALSRPLVAGDASKTIIVDVAFWDHLAQVTHTSPLVVNCGHFMGIGGSGNVDSIVSLPTISADYFSYQIIPVTANRVPNSSLNIAFRRANQGYTRVSVRATLIG